MNDRMPDDSSIEWDSVLAQLLTDWAEAVGVTLHHGETLRLVTEADLLELMRDVQFAERTRWTQWLESQEGKR